MIARNIAIGSIAIFAISTWASAEIHRDKKAVRQFVKQQACPSTGKHKLPCPGWVIDHVIPLCAGGPDRPSNMQWQTIDEAKEKDRQERKQCRR